MNEPESAITAQGVRKNYGGQAGGAGLNGFDLRVPAGSVCGLLGPNGAGKTTAVRILSTLLDMDAGRASVAGFDVRTQGRRVRERIGLVGQYAAVDEILTGRQNLVMFGRLNHLPVAAARRRADELLERFSLTEAAGRPAGGYSGGMRRRLDLAASLIVSPPVLFVDEPTTGLDPAARQEVWTAVRELVDAGTTVLLTTQYLEEADRLADRICMLGAGRVVAEGAPTSSSPPSAGTGSTWCSPGRRTSRRPGPSPPGSPRGAARRGSGPPDRHPRRRAHPGADPGRDRAERGGDRAGGHRAPPSHPRRGLPPPDG
nr:hypothetical protein GCM10020093_039570 [Planobispora longispora]